ncbi:MAG: hypothetical protein ACOC5A_04945 [Halanaerobiales bacterium]
MDIKQINEHCKRPEIFKKSSADFWDHPHYYSFYSDVTGKKFSVESETLAVVTYK